MKTERNYEKELIKKIEDISYIAGLYSTDVWSYLITIIACDIDTLFIPNEKRKEEKHSLVQRLNLTDKTHLISETIAIISDALQDNPEQDFLGHTYMNLNLGKKSYGQTFTPYHISELMSKLTFNKEIYEKACSDEEYVKVSDCCVGGGVMLIAHHNMIKEEGLPSRKFLYIGQDIDRTAIMMAYIQLSFLGCNACLCVGNSLTHPVQFNKDGITPISTKDNEIWTTIGYKMIILDNLKKEIDNLYQKTV